VFFGCVFGGNHKWRVWDYTFGPEQADEKGEQRTNGSVDDYEPQ
jgi:hypothetical protein